MQTTQGFDRIEFSYSLLLMNVPLLDLTEQNRKLRPEIEAALRRVLDTNGFILGSEVKALEDELAAYCGTKYCVGVANGTDAVRFALMASGVGKGDAVVTVDRGPTVEIPVRIGPGHRFQEGVHRGGTESLSDRQP